MTEVRKLLIPIRQLNPRSIIPLDSETLELESLARSAGYTEDEICDLLGKPVKELPLFLPDKSELIIEFEDVPY